MDEEQNPFHQGDEVIFCPDRRTIGWYQHSFERWGIHPGYMGTVTKVLADQVEVDEKRESTMHWSQFRRAAEVPVDEREAMIADYKRKIK